MPFYQTASYICASLDFAVLPDLLLCELARLLFDLLDLEEWCLPIEFETKR